MIKSEVRTIQALRGVAAWFVVIGHFIGITAIISGKLEPWVSMARYSQETIESFGVDIFFVISGFIMVVATSRPRRNNRLAEVCDFLARRFFRIFPLFWVVLLIAIVWGEPSVSVDGYNVILTAILYDTAKAVPISWTLIFEVRFYLMMAIAVIVLPKDTGNRTMLICFSIVAVVFAQKYGAIPYSRFGTNVMLEFVFGAIVGLLHLNEIRSSSRLAMVLGAGGILATAVFLPLVAPGQVAAYRIFGYGMPAALLIYGLVATEESMTIKLPRFLLNAGDASYSIYLWHWVVMTILVDCIDHLGTGHEQTILFLLVSFPIVAIVGKMSFIFIEMPIAAATHSLLGKRLPSSEPQRITLA